MENEKRSVQNGEVNSWRLAVFSQEDRGLEIEYRDLSTAVHGVRAAGGIAGNGLEVFVAGGDRGHLDDRFGDGIDHFGVGGFRLHFARAIHLGGRG